MVELVARALSETGAAADWEHALVSAKAAIEAAGIESLMEALKPFARAADDLVTPGKRVDWHDFERARLALQKMSALTDGSGQ